jgi:hypothetical protein
LGICCPCSMFGFHTYKNIGSFFFHHYVFSTCSFFLCLERLILETVISWPESWCVIPFHNFLSVHKKHDLFLSGIVTEIECKLMYFFTHPNEDISFFGYMIFKCLFNRSHYRISILLTVSLCRWQMLWTTFWPY